MCDLAFNQGCRGVIPGPRLDEWVLLFELRIARKYLDSLGNGTTFKELSENGLADALIAVPSVSEQHVIRNRLKRRLGLWRNTTGLVGKQIDLLVEHRQTLIMAAVTGEVDLAEAA